MGIRLKSAEILIGSLLLVGAGLLFSNSYFCFFNQASCGMVEPLLALPVTWLGICFTTAGICRGRHSGVVALAYASIAVSALLVASQLALARGGA
ncbi:hypothetical protein J2X06_000027 [Lysobacter niastensis]|uniref:Transmembrane protein n=1 Tax=Lysobacter niastensis TaxID=380629 RepID=A0ABU1W5K4_9GAMM|nr:hypothetical protein [Lysobacter niastensis]